MKIFGTHISSGAFDYLSNHLGQINSIKEANNKLYRAFGIVNFFECENDFQLLKKSLLLTENIVSESDRAEYGDFQTNSELTNSIAYYLTTKKIQPSIVIEPTCGKGSFIIASLAHFNKIKQVFGIEIYKPYVWESKFNIIDFYLHNPSENKPDISIIHSSIFDFDFNSILKDIKTSELLIIGNPPWVTNSKLGSLNSSNLPEKRNYKNYSGIDAITGRSNFDIAEYITMMMIEQFQNKEGHVALLVKNSVIKNILFEQNIKKNAISGFEKHRIDSKKEFNVSVEASLFYFKLNTKPAYKCTEFDFYNNSEPTLNFGWLKDKFISNTKLYIDSKEVDGLCPFEWRQGVKHDCSSIMELEKRDGFFVNTLNETIELEDNLVYGILKSSDLKDIVVGKTRKFTIITQTKVGQETNYIERLFPKTFSYLNTHKKNFNTRKSSIYKNKPLFSIFGIGDYSFKPYKVAISGLYKTFHFTLVLPHNGKPIMLDDTCYMLGFSKKEFAVYTLLILNSDLVTRFLKSIIFLDAKRAFTKDVLMRIDLAQVANLIGKGKISEKLDVFNETYNTNLNMDLWNDFIEEISLVRNQQLELFN
ncbi:MAG: SAM-dependent methyltransferase [Chitinophagales bacterium]|nr:SAM-dependent methyltransferase [Chitinophagales bacterium]